MTCFCSCRSDESLKVLRASLPMGCKHVHRDLCFLCEQRRLGLTSLLGCR